MAGKAAAFCYHAAMNSLYSLVDAWQAYEAGQYELAATIWKALIEVAPDAETRRSHALGYSYVLVAQQKWTEARTLLQQLQAETGEPVYFHQLGLLERQAGNSQAAQTAFDAEARLLPADDDWSRAANLRERAVTALLTGETRLALAWAEESLLLARKLGDAGLEAQSHRLLGEVAQAEGNLQRARECYADAAVAYAMNGDALGEQEMADRINRL